MIQLATLEQCTGCGACAYICPKKCIVMRENEMGIFYPQIKSDVCIECGACQRNCPILNQPKLHFPKKVYAARSNITLESKTSASGGIAAEFYKQMLEDGYNIIGAIQHEDFSVTLNLATSTNDINKFKNSKYVFSHGYAVYSKIKELLKQNKKILVIALPCQIASISKIFNDHPCLFLCDVVCHGTSPLRYLHEHIKYLENKNKKKAVYMSFRDPYFDTRTYTFTLYDKNKQCFYAKRSKEGDTYQWGYHRGIIYRENCYHCHFAQINRVSDITLADYPGLGKKVPFNHQRENISCVLINTSKGKQHFDRLIMTKRITAFLRPLEEAFEGNSQLRRPTPKNSMRITFEKQMVKNNYQFEKVMKSITTHGLLKENYHLYINSLKYRIRKCLKRILKK